MRYTVRRASETLGTFTLFEIQDGFHGGRFRLSDMAMADGASEWIPVSMLLGSATTLPLERPSLDAAPPREADPEEAARFRQRLASYERTSGIVWIVIAAIQIVCVVTAVAGLWNIYAAVSRFRFARAIREGHPGVVAAYEGSLWILIVMGCVNFFLGGFIAAAWIGFDFHVRRKVLANRHLLESSAPAGTAR